MKKFHFRLEKYHNFKEQEEKAARLELFRARRAYQEEADKLAALQGKTIKLISQNKKLLTGSIQLELLNNCIGCLAVQKNLEEEQAAAVQEKEEKMKREQQVYLEVRKASKLLERLYHRQWNEFYQEYLKEEQKVLDEIGLIIHSRE